MPQVFSPTSLSDGRQSIPSGEMTTEFSNPESPSSLEDTVDKTLTSSASPILLSAEAGRSIAISKITDIFTSFARALDEPMDKLVIPIRSRHSHVSQVENPDNSDSSRSRIRGVTFPGKTPKEAWKFTVLVRILELIHEALTKKIIMTKRDIYYKDPTLFHEQAVVDRYVDDIAFTFSVRRIHLNVVAASKGQIAGTVLITFRDGALVHATTGAEGILVPDVQNVWSIDITGINWVLVIEKEASFRSLVSAKFYQNAQCGNGMLITAKGYPDITTREFLRRVSTSCTSSSSAPPIYMLGDWDPWGISIMSTYKHGSKSLAHENAELTVPRVQWLGVRSSDLNIGNSSSMTEGSDLLRMTERDRKKAREMLGKDAFSEGGTEVETRKELQMMLMLNLKAEIQQVGQEQNRWLGNRLLEELCR